LSKHRAIAIVGRPGLCIARSARSRINVGYY
jgi:hypothetical protein